MPIYLGANKLDGIHLGAGEISKVYLGQTLVYRKGSGPTPPSAGVLFDHGWISGISWAGNQLPRPRYTSIATYDFSQAANAYMRLIINSEEQYSAVTQNCHVCTASEVRVPAGAAKMKVTYQLITSYMPRSAEPFVKFGLLTPDCVNSCDASNGGALSEWIDMSASADEHTGELTLPSGIAGSDWIAVVNYRNTANCEDPLSLRIYKVWFE